MRLVILMSVAGLALSACASSVPESGVGFGDYAQFERDQAQRTSALQGATLPTTQPGLPAPSAVTTGGIGSSDLAAAGIGGGGAPMGQAASQPVMIGDFQVPQAATRPGGIEASPTNAAPQLVGTAPAPSANSGGRISDEQDFDAVATRESIESDAIRRQQQAAQYQVIAPTALPDPPRSTGPNIVEFALNAPNRRGQPWYSRPVFASQSRFQRNCLRYRSPDEAQRDFLSRGGPERDPLGIDPDGDGFACGWDPAPFRAAVGRS